MIAFLVSIFAAGCGEKTAPSDEPAPPPESAQSGDSLTKGALVYTPAFFQVEAKAGDETVSAHFTIRNDGETQVKVTKLDTTCACLKVEVADTVLDPGESTTLDAVFEIEKLMGEAEKMIMVETDQPGVRAALLPVKVNVPPILEIEPKNVKWKVGEKPEPRTFTFRTLRDKPIHVTEVSSSRPEMVTASLEEVEKGRIYKITVTPKSTDDFMLGFVRITNDVEIDDHKLQMAFFTIDDN